MRSSGGMADLTCIDCQSAADPGQGYLRPEGFLCRSCYERRIADPEYVAQLERELLRLVATATGDTEARDQTLSVPVPSEGPAQRALDSLTGLAVGDALGATREGQPYAPEAPPLSLPSPGSPAPWTDDTQMALSVFEVLLEAGEIDTDRLARAFARRYEGWRGYGAGMHTLLSRLRAGEDWHTARFAVFRDGSFGNGSAMRVAPLGAFLAARPVDEAIEQATRSAVVTHPHPEGVAGAVAVALAAWHAARSRGGPAPEAARVLEAVGAAFPTGSAVADGLESARALPQDTDLGRAVALLGNGSHVSCADTVPLALWIATSHSDDYRVAVETAVAAGGDTDTMAAIVGGIVAARGSVSAIPAEWRDVVEPLPLRS